MKGKMMFLVSVFLVVFLALNTAVCYGSSMPSIDVSMTPDPAEHDNNIVCTADVSDPDGDLERIEYMWYVNGIHVRSRSTSIYGFSGTETDTLLSFFTSEGDAVRCEVAVYDSEDQHESDTDELYIGANPNEKPDVDIIVISPTNPETDDDITCEADVSDPDGNLLDLTFRWYVNSVPVRTNTETVSGSSDSETDTLLNSFTDYDDVVKCEVEVTDSEALSDSDYSIVSVASAPQPSNDPPIVTSVDITPSNPEATDDLQCDAVLADTNGNLDHAIFRWLVNGVIVKTDTEPVYGYSDSEFDLLSSSYIDYGDSVICEVEVFDAESETDENQDYVTVSDAVILNPPSIDATVMIPTSPENNEDITCDVDVSDNDGNLDYVDFEWYVNGLLKRSVKKAVSGHVDSETDVLQDVYTYYGNVVKCDVTVHDTTDLSDHDYNQVTVQSHYQGDPPTIDDLPDRWTEVAEGIEEIDLWDYASDTEDPDSNLDFSVDYQSHDEIIDCYISSNRYLRCHGAEEGGHSDLTVRVEDTQGLWDTDVMRVWVDDFCGGECDRNPEIDSISFDPEYPDEGDDIRCEVEVSDPDGDLDYVEFRWFVEGDLERQRTKEVSGYYDDDYDVLPYSYTDNDDEVKCYVEVFDREGNEDSDYEKVWIDDNGNNGDEDCNIDLYSLDVEDDEISFRIKNKGDRDEEATYRIYIDDDKEYQRTVNINDGDTRTFYYDDYDFDDEDHEYEIEVRAEAECGDEDNERIWYQRGEGYSGNCGVQIKNIDYTEIIDVSGYAHVDIDVKNTGSVRRYMTMRVFLDNTQVGMTSFWLDDDSTMSKSLTFRPSSGGTKTLKVTVDATCGASDTVYGTMYIGTTPGPSTGYCNYNSVCESGESWSNCPYDCSQPGTVSGPTEVDIRPSSFDVRLYKSKIITIDIDSYIAQEFRVSVDGIPSEWVDLDPVVWVDDQKNAYIFISPKQGGSHQFTVTVRSVTEGITYSKHIDMFVAVPDQEGSWDGFTGMVTGTATSIWFIVIVVIILAAVVVYFASMRLKHQHEVKMISFPRKNREI